MISYSCVTYEDVFLFCHIASELWKFNNKREKNVITMLRLNQQNSQELAIKKLNKVFFLEKNSSIQHHFMENLF